DRRAFRHAAAAPSTRRAAGERTSAPEGRRSRPAVPPAPTTRREAQWRAAIRRAPAGAGFAPGAAPACGAGESRESSDARRGRGTGQCIARRDRDRAERFARAEPRRAASPRPDTESIYLAPTQEEEEATPWIDDGRFVRSPVRSHCARA